MLSTLRGTAYFRGQGQGTGFLMVVFRLFIFGCLISKTKKQQLQQQLKQQTVDQKHNKAKTKNKKTRVNASTKSGPFHSQSERSANSNMTCWSPYPTEVASPAVTQTIDLIKSVLPTTWG